MKALVVEPPRPGVALRDVPRPGLAAGAVRVRVLEVGICGTDHDIVEGAYGTPPDGRSDLILGHENLGVVTEIASEGVGFAPGDLVVATVRRGCGECRFCRTGQSDFCETGRYRERGIRGLDGYLAEEYVERPDYLVHVPASLRDVAVLLEPMSVVEKAIAQGEKVLERKEPTPGIPADRPRRALVAGTGAIGILAAVVLRLKGYDVVAIDRHGETTPAATILRAFGARHVDAAAGLGGVGQRAFDLVVEATGSSTLDVALFDCLAVNGTLVLTGIPDAAAPPAPVATGRLFRELVLANQAVVGSVNANRTYFEQGVADFASAERRWPGTLGRLITSRRPIDQFADVLAQRTGGAIKHVLQVADAAAGTAGPGSSVPRFDKP